MSGAGSHVRAIALICCLAGSSAGALEIELPVGAQLTAERGSALGSFRAPIAGFDGTEVSVLTLEGRIERRAWRISSPGLTPLQVIAPLRTQLEQQGYDPIFECEAITCGGFDFRFNVEVLPGPNMYVNIAEFRYLTAVLGDPAEPKAAVGVLVSVARDAAYVQIISADTPVNTVIEMPVLAAAPRTPAPEAEAAPTSLDLAGFLRQNGYAVLADLEFATGTSRLGDGPFPTIEALAAFMQEEPTYSVLLVGHTDTVGALAGNIALSRARAASVRDRLISAYGIDASRLDAQGMGYLSPIASNLTEEGRRQNRRVEAVLLSDR